MRKFGKPFLHKTNLLFLLFSLFVVPCFGQNGQTSKCKENDYDCLSAKSTRIIASECKGKGYDCWVIQYTTMIDSNPSDGAAYLGRGRVYFAKEPNLAIQDFNKAIELNPTYFQTYISLGLLYLAVKKDYDRAIIEFNNAMVAASQNTMDAGHRRRSYLQNAYVNRGAAYLQKRDFENALADHNTAIEMSPNDDSGYRGRASVYAAQQDYDKSIADYSKAIELSPDDWLILYSRASLSKARRKGEGRCRP